eukprot:TRINITY_DN32869_c0_g1_i1.p1 TRINITY_DN32869_c0_g1~~TRINITY_DN32869_c0_g1_i1.p1  ORF type:complete len:374 (+),score=130.91 TRINITY_DN32869_c0_g1_i1:326-1447(+)
MFTTPEKVFGKRPYRENVLKYVNLFVFIGNLVCFLVMALGVDQRASKSMKYFWTHKDFQMDEALSASLNVNCTLAGRSVDVSSWDVYYTMTKKNAPALMAHSAGLIRRAVWITGSTVILSGINKLLFERNVHDLRYYNITLRKGYLLMLEVCGIIWSIVAMAHPQEISAFIDDYIAACSPDTTSHLWEAPPFVVMYISHAVTLLLHGVTLFILVSYGQDHHRTQRPLIRKQYHELLAVLMLRKRSRDDAQYSKKGGSEPLVELTVWQLLRLVKEKLLGAVSPAEAAAAGVEGVQYTVPKQPPPPPPPHAPQSQYTAAYSSPSPGEYDSQDRSHPRSYPSAHHTFRSQSQSHQSHQSFQQPTRHFSDNLSEFPS